MECKVWPPRMNGPVAYIALYGAMYAAFGVASPFWPKFYASKALTPQQIGIVLAVGMSMRLVAGPAIGLLADFVSALRLALSICLTLAAAAAAALLWADTFWLMLWTVLLQAAALAPTTSLADAFAVNAAKPEVAGRPFEYGWIRGSASIAFIMGTLTVGQLIGPSDLTPIIWLNVALLLVSAGLTTVLPTVKTQSRSSTCASPFLLQVRGLVGLARFRILLFVSALVLGSHAMHDAFAVIRWSEAGIGTSAISVLWFEAVAAEVIVFLVIGPKLLSRLGSRTAAALAAAAGVIRWTVSGMTTSILLLSLIQPLHGLTFALLHLACMRMMATLVAPSLSATAQAFYAFGAGFVTTVLTLLSGILFARFGGAAFFMMAALCGLAVPFAWFGFAKNPSLQTAGGG
jgi:MFS transporter, PPP family, 3-phenylpropionic acid transporter